MCRKIGVPGSLQNQGLISSSVSALLGLLTKVRQEEVGALCNGLWLSGGEKL